MLKVVFLISMLACTAFIGTLLATETILFLSFVVGRLNMVPGLRSKTLDFISRMKGTIVEKTTSYCIPTPADEGGQKKVD